MGRARKRAIYKRVEEAIGVCRHRVARLQTSNRTAIPLQLRWQGKATNAPPSHNAYTRAYFSRVALGPWGSLVYPWWFGTTRLRFKSGRTHSLGVRTSVSPPSLFEWGRGVGAHGGIRGRPNPVRPRQARRGPPLRGVDRDVADRGPGRGEGMKSPRVIRAAGRNGDVGQRVERVRREALERVDGFGQRWLAQD